MKERKKMEEYQKVQEVSTIAFLFYFVFKIKESYFKGHSQYRENHRRERLVKSSPRKIRRKQMRTKPVKEKRSKQIAEEENTVKK